MLHEELDLDTGPLAGETATGSFTCDTTAAPVGSDGTDDLLPLTTFSMTFLDNG